MFAKFVLPFVAFLVIPGFGLAQYDAERKAEDLKLLQAMGLKADGTSLLEYFRKRTFPEADPKKLTVLIKDLGDEDFKAREKAHADLLDLGNSALVAVKQAEESKDAEIRGRAQEIRQRIEAKAEPNIQAATARLIGDAKPAGAVLVLLNYLPFAADDSVVDEIARSLAVLAKVKGQGEPELAKALADKHSLKRAAAGQALAGIKDHNEAVRGLLKDADPAVRLRVGLALVELKEKDALPVLVDLLAVLPAEKLWPVEELFVRLAGEQVPQVSLGTNEASRKMCRDAWHDWFTKNQAKIDLAKLDQQQALLGYTLLVMQNVNRFVGGKRVPAQGEVMELDGAKQARWKFTVPTYPVDAQIIGQDRIIIAEYQGGRVSERDFKGNVKWEKAVGGNPIGIQGLPNGNVFVVTQNRLVEYDRGQKEVFVFQRPNHDIFRARKLRNGDVVYITNAGVLTCLDPSNHKVKRTFNVGNIPILFGSIDVLPNGGVLIPDFQRNRVVEYDPNGKEVKQFSVQWPNSAIRLPNGNTLVASQNTRRIIEFNPAGQEVWTYTTPGMVFNARKR